MNKCATLLLITMISFACRGPVDGNTVDRKVEPSVHPDISPTSIGLSHQSDTSRPLISVRSQQIPNEASLNQPIRGVTSRELLEFAQTLIGTPYKYGSTDPLNGFDCSGFITYVFNHFNIAVPRSSVDFTNTGKEVPVQTAKEGDLILFTGTVDSIHIVGHMGIVTENVDTLRFIHSTSGKANGVTISALKNYYQKRFVKVIRVLAD